MSRYVEGEFDGVFMPAEILNDSCLTPDEKMILTAIVAFDDEEGCTMSNAELTKFCTCSATTIGRAVAKFRELVYAWIESFDGRTRVLRSSLMHPMTDEGPVK